MKTRLVPHRRRREQKTDYPRRLALVKSGKSRLVVRKSLSHTLVQFVEYSEKGDKILVSASSRELKKLGWKAGCGNLPAAYLTGLLGGLRAKPKLSEAVLDIGLQTSTPGSRLYEAVKGVLETNIAVPVDKVVLPADDRVSGKHISASLAKDVDTVKQKIMQSVKS